MAEISLLKKGTGSVPQTHSSTADDATLNKVTFNKNSLHNPTTAPTVAQGAMYFDSGAGKFKASEDGATFVNVIQAGGAGDTTVVKLTSQTVDVGAANGDPVFFDTGTSSWKKATSSTTEPNGVFTATGEVTLFGKTTTLSGLTAGNIYYMANAGGLTTTATATKIGWAQSTTALLIDIDVRKAVLG